MVKNTNDIQQLRILMEKHYKRIDKRLTNYESSIEKLIEKLDKKKRYLTYDQIPEMVNIKVHSYIESEKSKERS